MDCNDWDLSAVVRGCSLKGKAKVEPADHFACIVRIEENLISTEKKEFSENLPLCVPSSSTTHNTANELEETYKLFVSKPPNQQQKQKQVKKPRQQQQLPRSLIPRSQRRNQVKKVVKQVPADGVSADEWAWRKYGQKPIKGSPYPRGYYRCSTGKGCVARKLVEKCSTDPHIYVVTYVGEHNHPIPTHRNHLQGSTRRKVPSSPVEDNEQPLSPVSPVSADFSPNTPLTSEMEEEQGAEGQLAVEDMELVGEDDFQFIGGSDDSAAAAEPEYCSLFEDELLFGLRSIGNNKSTLAGGS